MTLAIFGYLVIGLGFLVAGGEALVRGAVASGLRMGLTPLAAGMTIVAFGTSSPELIVNLRAAALGVDGLAVGNVIGSNIANIGLILGLSILIRPVTLDVRLVRNDILIKMVTVICIVLFLLDGTLSRLEGLVLFIGIILTITYNLIAAKKSREITQTRFEESVPTAPFALWADLLLVALGLAVLTLGGFWFVKGAVELAESLGATPALIGLTIVAVGTSMPELACSVVAAFRGYGDLAIGNVVGSNTFNILFVLGLTALILPLGRGAVSDIDLLVMLVFSLYFMRMLKIGARMARWEGLVLISGFGAYMAWLLT